MADEVQLLKWEITDYLFQHDFNRVEQAAKRLLDKPGTFELEFSFKEGEELRSKLEVPDEKAAMEFAIAMSHFLRDGSPRTPDAWIDFLTEIAGSEHEEFFALAREALARAKEGFFPITINGRRFRSKEIYNALATNVVFAADTAAREYLIRLQRDPHTGNLFWMTYYHYCLDVWRVLQTVKKYRREHGIYPPQVKRQNQCIYCRRKTGSFTRTEHIIPESLGNETSLLPPGFVCDNCNEDIGKVESTMVNGLPFKLLRPFLLWENKKARLPSARFSNIHFERVSPNCVNFHTQTKESVLREEELPDGQVKITFDVKERLDAHSLARGLMKIGLGVIALENGRDIAMDTKYDHARRYIINGGTFPNKMLIVKRYTPRLGGTMQWIHTKDGGTGMVLQILGATFGIALTEKPEVEARGPLLGHVLLFDLREEKPGRPAEAG